MGGQLEGKVAVVIGAARGIGKAVAKRLAEERARLVLGDRDADLLAETGGGLGAEFGVCDVAEKTERRRPVGPCPRTPASPATVRRGRIT
jgi:3-oxoacyl-[acyl-carrier protein] reductase